MKTYHGLRRLVLSVCLWLGLGMAWAGFVEVGAMRLDYGDAWQRGDGAEEAEDDSFILRASGGAELAVYAPRRAIPLKIDEERFYEQLERKWRGQYGANARIRTLLMAGRTWRMCIRPSLEKPATVFHMVTVEAGRAHHLLAVGARDASELPEAVAILIAGASWLTSERVEIAAAPTPGANAPASQPPVVGAVASFAPVAKAGSEESAKTPAQAASVAESIPARAPSAAVAPATRWKLLRAGRKISQGEALAELADIESRRLGDAGMLLGYGLRTPENALEWFVDGYLFDPFTPGKAGRRSFAHAWRLDWTPPAFLDFVDGAAIRVRFSGGGQNTSRDGMAGLHAEVRMLCGARQAMAQAFDALDRGAAEAETRFAELARACPGDIPMPRVASVLATAAERDAAMPTGLDRTLPLGARPELTADPPKDQVARLLLALRGIASVRGDAPGDVLLGGATAYYIYGSEAK
jgi:hypothetical protein